MKLILGRVGQHKTVTECARAGTRDTGCEHYRFRGGGVPGISQRPGLGDFGEGEGVSGRESFMNKGVEAAEDRDGQELERRLAHLG